MTTNKKPPKMTVAEAFAKMRADEQAGLDFSGKSAIDSLDLVDFHKKELCGKLFDIYKSADYTDEQMAKLSRAISVVEIRAVIKFRTERLTLERLAELYSHASGKSNFLNSLKKSMIDAIKDHPGLDKIKLNGQIKGHLLKGGSSLLSLDFLVGLIEKIELVAPQSKKISISA